jgi:ribonucleoside-diphosphate reductase beta chain
MHVHNGIQRLKSVSSGIPGDKAAKVAFVTIYHQILEATLSLTTFKFATRYLEREGLLPGFVAGYSKIHHDEHRHIAYGTWFLRQAVAKTPAMGDVVRQTLRDLLPAVAEALTPPEGADASMLGASADELRSFALDGDCARQPACHRRSSGTLGRHARGRA